MMYKLVHQKVSIPLPQLIAYTRSQPAQVQDTPYKLHLPPEVFLPENHHPVEHVSASRHIVENLQAVAHPLISQMYTGYTLDIYH